MNGEITRAALVQGPTADAGQTNSVTRLEGSGSQSHGPLTVGQFASIRAVTDLRFRLTAAASTAVATDVFLPAGEKERWIVESNTKHVAVIDDSGGSVEAHVWASSGPAQDA